MMRAPTFASCYSVNAEEAGGAGPTTVLGAERPVILAGRSSSCNLRIRHASCSGKHCSLTFTSEEGIVTVEDMSSNGTFVDGERITKHKPTRVRVGLNRIDLIEGRGNVVELNVRRETNFTQLQINGAAAVETADPVKTIDLTGRAAEPIHNICAAQALFVAQHAALIASWSPKLDSATEKLL